MYNGQIINENTIFFLEYLLINMKSFVFVGDIFIENLAELIDVVPGVLSVCLVVVNEGLLETIDIEPIKQSHILLLITSLVYVLIDDVDVIIVVADMMFVASIDVSKTYKNNIF